MREKNDVSTEFEAVLTFTKLRMQIYSFDGESSLNIKVFETIDAEYSSHVWTSSVYLSQFIWDHQKLFYDDALLHDISLLHSTFDENMDIPKFGTVLELGCGVGLVGLLTASLGSKTVFSDLLIAKDSIEKALESNSLVGEFIELDWYSSADQILSSTSHFLKDLDVILGADLFYEPMDFEPLLALVATLLSNAKPTTIFLTAYHERSVKRCIQGILDRYKLQATQIIYEPELKNANPLIETELVSIRLFVIKYLHCYFLTGAGDGS